MPQLAGGGDFPDLTGDGKVTQADILKGRGVQLKAEGGEMMMEETEMMAPSGDEIESKLDGSSRHATRISSARPICPNGY